MFKRMITSLFCILLLLSSSLGSRIQQVDAAEASNLPGLHLLRSDAQGIEIELNIPDYQIKKEVLAGKTYQRLIVPGSVQSDAPGQPQLPVFSTLLGLPPGVALQAEIEADDSMPVSGGFSLPLAQAPAPLQEALQPGEMLTSPQIKVHLSSGPYPSSPIRLADEAYIRDQRVVRLELYPFQYDSQSGVLTWHRQLRVVVRFDGVAAQTKSAMATESDVAFEPVFQDSLLNYDSARQWRSAAPAATEFADVISPTQSLGPRYKVVVDHDGMYQIGYTELQQAGMDVANVDPATFRMSSQGAEVAIQVSNEDGDEHKFSPGEKITFYGQKFYGDRLAQRYQAEDDSWPKLGPQNWQPHLTAEQLEKYTDDNVYWLMVGAGSGARMTTADGAPHDNAPVPAFFTDTVKAEQSHEWWTFHFTSEDTWFWQIMNATNTTYTFTTTLSIPYSGTYTATVTGAVVSKNFNDNLNPDHHTQVYLNDWPTALEDADWDGPTRHIFQGQVPQAALHQGVNQLEFVMKPVSQAEKMYFDWFSIEYARRFEAQNGQLDFTSQLSGTYQYQVSGFSGTQVAVYDIRDPLNPVQILHPHLDQVMLHTYLPAVYGSAGNGSRLASVGPQANVPVRVDFQVNQTPGARFLVVSPVAWQTPKSISFYEPPDLFSPINGADYLFISHHDFLTATQALADYRAAQGLRTRVIDVADLYNEFTDGIFNPLAIKSFLAYAYVHWQPPAPSYVLLVGNGHWNFKGYTGDTNNYWSRPEYMPPNLEWVDPWQGEVDSSSLLAAVSGNDILPDMFIGRLPVDTPEQVQAVVDKTIAYEHNPGADWQHRLLFIADNQDSAGNFAWMNNQVITATLPANYAADKIYLDNYDIDPQNLVCLNCQGIPDLITRTLNTTGTLFLNYSGHAADERWADEGIFKTTAVAGQAELPLYNNVLGLDNLDRLPVIVSMDCLDGYWIHTLPNKISLAVEMVRTAGRGAVAAFSPTGLGLSDGHQSLHTGFYNAVFRDGVQQLGPATLASKLALFTTGGNLDLVDTYTIFGDPALNLLTSVAPVQAEQSGSPFQVLAYNLQLTNVSLVTDTLTLSNSGGWFVDFSAPQNQVTLGPGASTIVSVNVHIPGSPAPGDENTSEISVASTERNGTIIATARLVTSAMP